MTSKSLSIPKHIADFINSSNLLPVAKLVQLSHEKRFEHSALGDRLELAGTLYKGFALMGLKEDLGHGAYLAGLARVGVEPTGAWRAQSIVELSKRVGASNFAALQNLTPTKLGMMTKWNDQELKDFFSGNEVRGITYDDAMELPTRELERRLKEAQTSSNELEQELEKEKTARAKAEDKNRLLLKKQMEPEGFLYPATVERVRIEGSVLSSQANLCLDDMEQFMNELMHATDLSSNKEKQLAEFSAGATTLYLNLKSVQSKAAYLLSWFAKTIGEDYMPDSPEDIPRMTEKEAMRIYDMRSVMLDEHRVDKIVREDARKSKRRGRGAKGKKA